MDFGFDDFDFNCEDYGQNDNFFGDLVTPADLGSVCDDLVERKPDISLPALNIKSIIPSDVPVPPVFLRAVQAFVDMKCGLDLRQLSISIKGCEYNPRNVNVAIIRLPDPKCTAMVYSRGTMMLLGAKCIPMAKRAAKFVAKLVKAAGNDDAQFCNFKIINSIASADVGFPVRLDSFAKDHYLYCTYEPEVSSSVRYRYEPAGGVKAAVQIFVSGKICITGCTTVEGLDQVMRDMFAVLYPYCEG